MFSTRIAPLRFGVSRLIFRSSYQHNVFSSQRRFYPSSEVGNTLSKGKNLYGDDIFTSVNAPETVSVVENIPEASFESLGLGGPTPIGLVQHALEFLHVSADLPWWGAIVAGTVVVRLCLFPVVVKTRQEMTKLIATSFTMTKLLNDLIKAQKEQKSDVVLELDRRRDAIMSQLKYSKVILPSLVQGSVFLSMALAVRQISSRQIESFMTGGLGWFTDLTVPDPFCILPFITASSILAILFVGSDSNIPLPRHVRLVFYGMCPVIFLLLFKYEAAFTFYLCVNSVITITQTAVLKRPAMQSYLNLTLPKVEQRKGTSDDLHELRRALEELSERAMLEKLENEKKNSKNKKEEEKQSFSEEEKKEKRP